MFDKADPAYLAESKVPSILIGTIVPTFIGTFFIFARAYTRAIISSAWGKDDTIIVSAWALSIVLTGLNLVELRYGAGRHIVTLSLEGAIQAAKVGYVARLFYQAVLSITKLGICTFYLRIFQDHTSRKMNYAMMVFVLLYTIPLEFIVIFRCKPIAAIWDFTIQNPKCMGEVPGIYANGIFNIVSDALLMAFVIPRVFPLKMARRQKISLLVIVSLGILVIIAAIIRLVRALKLQNTDDLTYNSSDVTTWTSVEINTGLFCASAPCIRPLLRRIAPNFMSSASGGTSGPSHGKFKSKSHTALSTRRGAPLEAFELHSRAEHEFGDNKTGNVSNAYWSGGFDDGDSQTEVLADHKNNSNRTDIMKTVSVLVTDGGSTEKISETGGDVSARNIVKFDHE